jgi:hypothetical protein
MSEHTESAFSFSVWNTVTDAFLQGKHGDYYWESIEDFSKSGFSEEIVQRVRILLPRLVADAVNDSSLETQK